jgi:hypothetical protein
LIGRSFSSGLKVSVIGTPCAAMHFVFLLFAGPLRLYARTLTNDPRAAKKLFSVRGYMHLYQLAKTQTPY